MELLTLLENDSKMRINTISRKLGVPPSTVHHRIKRMEESGVIRNYTIRKDHGKLGLALKAHVMVFVDVTQIKKMGKSQKDIAKAIRKIGGVEMADIVSGDSDILVTARCHGMQEFQSMLLDRIQSIEGITKTKTMIVISEE